MALPRKRLQDRMSHFPLSCDSLGLAHFYLRQTISRNGRNEFLGVGLLGVIVNGFTGSKFDKFTPIHNRHHIAHELHHAEVVAYEDVRETHLCLEVFEEVEDLKHRDIQGRNRFVADDQIRLQRRERAIQIADADHLRICDTDSDTVYRAAQLYRVIR